MSIGMLVAGIACLLAGLLAIGFGVPINEFGLGNTLIVAGTVGACTGLIILSLWVVVRELKGMAARLGAGALPDLGRPQAPAALPRPLAADSAAHEPDLGETAGGAPPMPSEPWLEEAAQRGRQDTPPALPPESQPAKQRRNLMFSSTSRRERERAQARSGEQAANEPRPAPPVAPAEIDEPAPATFDDAWPKSERSRPSEVPAQRRPARMPSAASSETAAARQTPPAADQAAVTVLKSGVVDGMAYSLYSDGSIEAQMPEGMMRFASIDELRAHLDQRP
ncbi:MAG TPA: DUF308 domain-containing protein [Bradyrhizobium sp.]|uniref:DUF308 domain-containing protein n=1 Tax=Bradyrhizobium sp. TaxID=376 RepID=UPI002D7EB9DA|nr:DUF308 domain-containing protein [Bradyrhizobium sp.]HET7887541.1 DUF308 domain-containing protein [Bradyrhizobium sp.]